MEGVIIHYGPYEAHGLIKHRIQRLRGLFQRLTILGYEIEIVEVNHLNRLAIEMCHRQIFACDIRYLGFNMDYEDDVVCQKAVAAVNEAKLRMSLELNVPKHQPIAKGKRHMEKLQRSENTQDFLSQTELLFEIPDKTARRAS